MLLTFKSIKKLSLLILYFLFVFSANSQVFTLKQCIDTALINNKNILIGTNNKSLSVQKYKEAKAGLLPKITAFADYKYYNDLPTQLLPLSVFNGPAGKFKEAQFGVPHNANANLQLTMPLYNPQIYGAIQTTKIASELSNLQYQKTSEQITFDISTLYYNAQILHHQLAFIDSNIINATSLLNNMQLLNEQLLAKTTDVSKMRLQVSLLNSQKETIKTRYEQVINSLKFLIGMPEDKNLIIDSTIQYQKSDDFKSTPTIDIKIIQTQTKLLAGELKTLNKSRFIPSVNIYGTYGTTGLGYDKSPNSFFNFYNLSFAGIQVSYPLFNGTITKRKMNQKKLELQNSELQTELLFEQNTMQIENATMQQLVAIKNIETTLEQIALAQEIYKQTVLQQKQGSANLTEVLLADNALREAQQNYLSAIIEYLKTELELKKITGNLSINK